MKFELQYTDPRSNARAGLITTDHGQIETLSSCLWEHWAV